MAREVPYSAAMERLKSISQGFACTLLLLASGASLFAAAESDESTRGFTFSERFQGSVNTLGAVNELDSNIGYNFNTHLGVDGGLPVYFVRPSSATTSTTGMTSSNGIGNAYGQVRLTFANPLVNFESSLTGTAPTGDKTAGFSTGHATADWSNYFDHSFSRLTPFGDVGIANSVSDTMFFIRPYTTYGFVTHMEGGAKYRLAPMLSVGASLYEIAPSGQQTVISRVVKAQSQSSSRQSHGAFETANQTTGSSNIAADHGFSAWVQVRPLKTINLFAAYTRSTQYSLDTLSFGVSFNVGSAIRSLGI